MSTATDPLVLLRTRNRLADDLLDATVKLQEAMESRDTDTVARRLDLRQGILDQIADLEKAVSEALGSGNLSNEVERILEHTHTTMRRIGELEDVCRRLGEQFRDEIAADLGRIRSARKVLRQYGTHPSNASHGFVKKTV